MAYEVTVLTTTYNRGKLLVNLYKSLCQQTVSNFQWLIIDDGSEDNTHAVVKKMQPMKFFLEYHYKTNGGKHTALNYAHPFIKGKVVFIVDSDDTLSNDAIELIVKDWKQYKSQEKIGVISYLKGRYDESSLANSTAADGYVSNHIAYRVNHNIGGDMAEVIRSDIFKKYLFPVFPGEKFMPEGWLWNQIALRYKTVYRQKIIYYAEYLEGGLTKSGRAMLMKNPRGLMTYCKTFFIPQVNLKMQVKEMLLYGVYAFCNQRPISHILKESDRPWKLLPIIPFAWGLYQYWKKKYCNG